jgi:hypothetical protein
MKFTMTIDTEKAIPRQVADELKRRKIKPIYIVKKADVGRRPIEARIINGVVEYPFTPLGYVIEGDVGKMCKKVDGHWYVENTEQFEARKLKSAI